MLLNPIIDLHHKKPQLQNQTLGSLVSQRFMGGCDTEHTWYQPHDAQKLWYQHCLMVEIYVQVAVCC